MSENKWIGKESHRIRVSEIDQQRKATLPALVNLMQEVAWNNSAALKYSVYDLMEHGVTWVVYRMQIHIRRYPGQQELLKVMSWPSGMDRLYTYRDYKIEDEQGHEIVRGTSAWLVMDIAKRELVSVPDFIRSGLDFSQEYERLELDRTKLKPVDQPEEGNPIHVTLFDMDVNEHVSNTNYFKWLLEAMDRQLKSGSRVKMIDIQFKGESKQGDELKVIWEQQAENTYRHQIVSIADNSELIRARTEWS